jgi:hypothetical protein
MNYLLYGARSDKQYNKFAINLIVHLNRDLYNPYNYLRQETHVLGKSCY